LSFLSRSKFVSSAPLAFIVDSAPRSGKASEWGREKTESQKWSFLRSWESFSLTETVESVMATRRKDRTGDCQSLKLADFCYWPSYCNSSMREHIRNWIGMRDQV